MVNFHSEENFSKATELLKELFEAMEEGRRPVPEF
jgi:hypothetical protein